MSERAQLALEGASLEAGESIRIVCPFCGGGSSRERSLVLTLRDDGALLYVCHRARCTARGCLGGGTGDAYRSRTPVVRTPRRPLVGEVRRVPEEIADQIARTYNFYTFPEHWRWDATYNRLLFPVLSPKWERRGWVSRSSGRSGPKSLNEKEIFDQPWLHWARISGDGRLFLVEDIPSAERLAEHGENAVSSMGCHVADDCLDEIVEQARGRQVVVTFDRDATGRSFDVAGQLSMRVPVRCGVLPKDIKNMTPEELSHWLNGGS